jgi:hypothetical protein
MRSGLKKALLLNENKWLMEEPLKMKGKKVAAE